MMMMMAVMMITRKRHRHMFTWFVDTIHLEHMSVPSCIMSRRAVTSDCYFIHVQYIFIIFDDGTHIMCKDLKKWGRISCSLGDDLWLYYVVISTIQIIGVILFCNHVSTTENQNWLWFITYEDIWFIICSFNFLCPALYLSLSLFLSFHSFFAFSPPLTFLTFLSFLSVIAEAYKNSNHLNGDIYFWRQTLTLQYVYFEMCQLCKIGSCNCRGIIGSSFLYIETI